MDPQVMEGALTPQDIFNLKVDSQARWDKLTSVKSNFDVPSPNFPNYNFNTNPLNKDTQMSVYDGLFSNNPHIKEQAESTINDAVMNSPAVKYNQGFHIDTPYDQARKFVDKEYGFDPLRDNDQFYYENEYANKGVLGRSWENLYKGVGRLAGGIVTKLGQGLGQLGAMVGSGIEEIFDPKGNQWMEDVAENSMTRWFDKAEETVKDDWLPVYKPSNWADKGFWQHLGSGQYWSDDLADGAAFMGSMIAESYLLGGVGKLAGLSRIGAATITGSGNIAKLARVALKAATGADDLAGVGTWALSVGGEAAMEASDTFKVVKQQLIEERQAGKNNYSDEDINNIAGDRAAGRFKANLAILSISNAFENRFIYQPLMKRLRGKAGGGLVEEEPSVIGKGIKVSENTESLDEFAKAELNRPEYTGKADRFFNIRKKLKDPMGSLRFYGTRALEATVMEGYWEENAQLAAERLSNQGHLNFSNFWDQYFKQTSAATKGNDKETAENIGAGAVIGIIGTAGTSLATRERRNLIKNTTEAVAQYENIRKQYLSFQNAYLTDDKGNYIKNDNGVGYKVDPKKATAILAGINEHLSKQITLDNVKDPVFRRFLQEQLLASYVFAAKQAGIHDIVSDRFNKLGTLTKDQLSSLGFDPSTPENLPAFQNAFQEQSKIYDDVFQSKKSPSRPRGVSEKEFEEEEKGRKNQLYTALTTSRATKRALDDYTSLSLSNQTNPANSPASVFQLHNSLAVQLMLLSQFANTLPKESTFYDKYVSDRQKDLFKQLVDVSQQMAEMQKNGGLTTVHAVDEAAGIDEERHVDPEMYKQFFDDKGNFINEKKDEFLKKFQEDEEDFVRHASLQNTLSQQEYLSNKLSDKKSGYKNYQDFKNHQKYQKEIDDDVDAEEAPKEVKDDVAAQKAEEEAKKKAEDEAKQKELEEKRKVKEEEERKKKEEEQWRKDHPKEALLKDIKEAASRIVNNSETLPQEVKDNFNKKVGTVDGEEVKNFFAKIFNDNLEHFNLEDIAGLSDAVDEYNKLLKDELTGKKEVKEEKQPILSPEEKAIEDQLGKEKADEARKQVKEWLDAGIIEGIYEGQAKNNPLQFLKEIAAQAQETGKGNSRQTAIDLFTEPVVSYAEELFPAPVSDREKNLEGIGISRTLPDGSVKKDETQNELTPSALEALQEAYDLQAQAISGTKTYEELLRELGYYQNENKIDEAVDKGKMNGYIVVPTMKPNEIKSDGSLTVADKPYLQARFNFLQKLSDNGNTDDFKLILYVENGNLKGRVANAENKILKFDSDGNISDKGVDVIFDLDLISYNNDSLGKERIEASKRKADPLKKALKNFELDNSFKTNDVDKKIIDYVEKSNDIVTASIDLVTQGQLVRPGITNNPNSLTDLSGKRKTLAQLKSEGKVYKNENGAVAKNTLPQNNTFIKSGRLNVRMKRNVNNENDGFEIVEFIPKKLSEMVDNNGKSLNLKPILEQAIKGQLGAEYETFLKNILNRREYLIIPLGTTVLVVNREKFVKKIKNLDEAKSANLLADELLQLTSIDEVMNSEFNVDSSLYQDTTNYKAAAQSYPDEVSDIIEHYQDVVNNNFTSSASQVKVSDSKEGVARVNKRLVVSLDQSFEDMTNKEILAGQKEVSDALSRLAERSRIMLEWSQELEKAKNTKKELSRSQEIPEVRKMLTVGNKFNFNGEEVTVQEYKDSQIKFVDKRGDTVMVFAKSKMEDEKFLSEFSYLLYQNGLDKVEDSDKNKEIEEINNKYSKMLEEFNSNKTEIKVEPLDKNAIVKILTSDEEVNLDEALNDLNCL